MNQHTDLLAIALDAAGAGAAFIRNARRPDSTAAWGLKGRSDFVTHVDRESEALIADRLGRAVPDSTVLGEELSPEAGAAELVWVVDPLDGTANYLHQYPAYAVSIAGVLRGEPVVGVVVDVPRDLTYRAVAGGGAWCGDSRLAVSTVGDPAAALIGTGFPFKDLTLLPGYQRQFHEILANTGGIRRAGAASLDFVDLAAGRFDGFWELQLAPWDVAAGTLLVREAGGRVSDLDGGTSVLRHGAYVAGNPAIHSWLLQTVRRIGS